ncbi:TIGR00374 family protein [Salinigranum rubrum]|uniref:TIGR00374 family protein n=1 Tax=Salinigranum rubrum TaxID=755307 RepID=A0A2I8VKU0_9EURY|nr:lysylphosphatidylglycerol synthase transmembrane domain-containing protein [Salinigranum rubrum]AUV82531.1 TIGR00374 family protein [Salinigranum rubrum]
MKSETNGGSTLVPRMGSLLRKHGVELTVLLGVAVFFGLIVAGDAEAVRRTFSAFDWTILFVVAGLTTGGFAFRFLKWEYYLRRLGIDVPLATSLLVFVSGLMMVITPMKGGGVWKGWLLKDTEDVPISRVIPVVFAERATDLLALSALAAIGIVLYNRSAVVVVGLVAAFVGIVLLVQWRAFCLTVLEWVGSLPVVGRYTDPLRIAYEDSYALFQLRPLTISYVLSLFAWTTEGISLWFVLRGFDVPAEPLFALSVFGIGSVVGGVSMLPGGLGAAEASIAGLLLAFGYSAAVATSATIVVRVGTLWYGAVFGAVGFGVFKLWRARS